MNYEEARNTLGLTENPSEDDVKKAFRKLAVEYHPDKNGNSKEAEDKFKQINQAYRIMTGQEQPEQQMPHGFGGFGGGFGRDDIGINFGDFFNFEEMFGIPRNGRVIQQPVLKDIVKAVKLTFEESVLGCTKEIRYTKTIYCDKCEGQGNIPSSTKCNVCNGEGKIGTTINSGNYVTRRYSICNGCNGVGRKLTVCDKCGGAKFKTEDCLFKIIIPGIYNNTQMIARGKGNEFKGFASSVIIQVIPTLEGEKGSEYENFYIDGLNVYSTAEIGFDQLMCGGKISVTTVGSKDKQELPIMPYTKIDSELVIQNCGLQTKEKKGNHIVQLKLKYPPRENLEGNHKQEIQTALNNLYNERING